MHVQRCFCAALCLLFAGALLASEPTRVAGTKVSLVPPVGFEAASEFPGFQKMDAAASIMITELPAPIDQLLVGMTEAKLAEQGMILVDRRSIELNGLKGELINVEQEAGGTLFEKQLCIIGRPDFSALVVAAYPKALSSDLRESMHAALMTSSVDLEREVPAREGLNFDLVESADLKISQRMAGGLLLTRDGAPAPQPPEAPVLIVASGMGPTGGSLEEFAKLRLYQIPLMTDVRIVEMKELEVAGKPAFEIIADAIHEGGTKVKLYQIVIQTPGAYIMSFGRTGVDAAETFLPQFSEISRGLKPKG